MPILEVSNLKKTYITRFGGHNVEALKNVTFNAEAGEYIAVMGESGSGKTTLLNMLAALDRPTGGSVILDGQELSKVKESAMALFRRDNLGFVFQDFNLLDTFSAKDNILLPLVLAGKKHSEMNTRLNEAAWVIRAAVEISLRAVGRAKAARSRRPRYNHKSEAAACRRAYG